MLSKQLLALIILISVVPLFLWIVGEAIDLSWERLRESLPIDHPFAVQHLWKWLGAVGILLLFMLAGTASEKISRASKKISTISSKLLLYALGILGPGILFGAYLVLCVLQISSPVLGSYTSDPDSAEAIANNADATVKIEILKAAAARTEAVAIGGCSDPDIPTKGDYPLEESQRHERESRCLVPKHTPRDQRQASPMGHRRC